MRTTLTLEDDVARRLQQEMKQSGRSLKEVVNQALRRGLTVEAREAPLFVVQPHSMQIRPGIDLNRMNQFVDELDVTDRPLAR